MAPNSIPAVTSATSLMPIAAVVLTKPAVPTTIEALVRVEVTVTKRVDSWAQVWSAQHVDAYLGFYDTSFKQDLNLPAAARGQKNDTSASSGLAHRCCQTSQPKCQVTAPMCQLWSTTHRYRP